MDCLVKTVYGGSEGFSFVPWCLSDDNGANFCLYLKDDDTTSLAQILMMSLPDVGY